MVQFLGKLDFFFIEVIRLRANGTGDGSIAISMVGYIENNYVTTGHHRPVHASEMPLRIIGIDNIEKWLYLATSVQLREHKYETNLISNWLL